MRRWLLLVLALVPLFPACRSVRPAVVQGTPGTDLRRLLESGSDLRSVRVSDAMTKSPRTIESTKLAVEAVKIMEERKINQILVVDEGNKLVGALNTHDLMQARVI